MEAEELVITAGQMTGYDDPICYLPFIKTEEFENTVVVGTYLLNKYYMVFDATPAGEQYNTEYFRIAFASADFSSGGGGEDEDDDGGGILPPHI